MVCLRVERILHGLAQRPTTLHRRAILLGTLAATLGTSPGVAAPVATEAFEYPDGPLFGGNGGFGWVDGWAGFLTNVAAQTAVGQSDTQFTGTRVFTNPQSTPELFVAFTVHVPADLGSDDFIGVHLNAGVNNSNLTVGKVAGSPYFIVGNGGFVESSIVVEPASTYRVIGVYDLDHSRTSMWVNPDATDYYDPLTGASSADATGIFSLFGHMDWLSFQGSVLGMGFDDIVIANAPEDVGLMADSPSTVPVDETRASLTAVVSPQPCRAVMQLILSSPQGGDATLAFYDARGGCVRRTELTLPSGSSTQRVPVADLPSGTYFYRLSARSGEVSGKCVIRR